MELADIADFGDIGLVSSTLTSSTKNLLLVRAWGFESPIPHQMFSVLNTILRLLNY